MHSDPFQLGSGLLRSLGADGGAIDHDAAGLEATGGTIRAEQHLVHRRVITDAKHQNIDVLRCCGWVDAALRAGELRVVFGSTAPGVHLQVEAGLMQVHRHREPQGPEAHHADPPVRSGHACVPGVTNCSF